MKTIPFFESAVVVRVRHGEVKLTICTGDLELYEEQISPRQCHDMATQMEAQIAAIVRGLREAAEEAIWGPT